MCFAGTGLDIEAQLVGSASALMSVAGGQKGTMPGIFWVLALPPKRLQLFTIDTKHKA